MILCKGRVRRLERRARLFLMEFCAFEGIFFGCHEGRRLIITAARCHASLDGFSANAASFASGTGDY